MRIEMNAGDALAAMNICAMVSASSANIDALRSTRISANGTVATFSATNTYEWVNSKIDCDGVCDFVADTQFIATKLKTLKASAGVIFDIDGETLQIISGKAKWKVPVLADIIPRDEFDMGSPVKLGPDFIKAVVHVSKAANPSDTRDYLRCVYVDGGRVVATNGNRMRMSTFDGMSPEKIMMPLGFIRNISATFSGDIDLYANNRCVMISDAKTSIRSSLIEGQYPDYERVISGAKSGAANNISVDSDDFISAITTATAIGKSGEKSSAHINTQLQFRSDKIIIMTRNSSGEEGLSESSCDRDVGIDADVGVNGEWVLSDASSFDCDRFDISYGGDQSPILMTHGRDTCLIMPMRFK